MMDAKLRRRLALVSILLIVGVIAGAAIIVLGADRAVPGSNNAYFSVVKPSQTGRSSDQITLQQAQFDERANNLTTIAIKDNRVSSILAGKNYTVLACLLYTSPSPRD